MTYSITIVVDSGRKIKHRLTHQLAAPSATDSYHPTDAGGRKLLINENVCV
jgi:hypothetical protein